MKQIKSLVFLLICLLPFFSLTAKADYDDNNGNGHAYGHDKHPKEGRNVPVDGGISLLLVAGAAFGAKKVFNKSKKNTLDS